VIATFTAITGGLNISAISPKAPWSLIFLVFFLIFAVIVIWGLYIRDRQIQRLQSKDAELERRRKELEIKERELNIEDAHKKAKQEKLDADRKALRETVKRLNPEYTEKQLDTWMHDL